MNFNEKCLLVIYGIILIFISYYVIDYFNNKSKLPDKNKEEEPFSNQDQVVSLGDYMKYRSAWGENLTLPECKCRPYLYPNLYSGDDSIECRDMLEDLMADALTGVKGIKNNRASSKTEGEFLNWCNSYRRRLYMFPKYYDAREKFLMFHNANLYTE